GPQSLGGDAIAVSFRDALDEPVQAQTTQIVSDSSRGELARLLSEQWSEVLAEIVVPKCALDEEEQEQDMQESLNARVGEAQRRRTLVVQADGLLHFLEGSFANETVVTDALDVEQTSVGREADHTQFFEIFDAPADGEVAGVVDRRFSSESLPLLVVLLDTRFLVVDVERRHHAVGDDAGTESAWCAPAYLAVEHQAHLAGPADIEVLTDHPLEEDAPGHRLIEHLGERELGLQNGELVAIARDTITRWKRVRQAPQPLAQQSIDLVRRQPVAQLLHQLGGAQDSMPLSSASNSTPRLAS